MITFRQGNLLRSDAEALVNTVNTVGVMGKGIALQFKTQFSKNYKLYVEACKKGTLRPGQMLVVKDGDLLGEKYIINFPTKEHWRAPSRIEYIEQGLPALKAAIQDHQIKSIAIPPLGCGSGGLDWNVVKPMIVDHLSDLDVQIFIYEPNIEIKQILQAENTPQQVKLTPAKAMLLYLMFHYEAFGDVSSLFAANKLAYFLQESGENLRLTFTAHHYGPYSVQLNHVLGAVNGVYLVGLEQNQAKAFEPLQLNYNRYEEVERFIQTKVNAFQRSRLQSVLKLIQGFESTYSLELLASVDYASKQAGVENVGQVQEAIQKWNPRKAHLFQPEHIELAYDHLKGFKSEILVS